MARYRQINTKIWNDPDFGRYSLEEKLVFIYLINNNATLECGVYLMPVETIARETGINPQVVTNILDGRLKNVVYDISSQYVYLRKFHAYNCGGNKDLVTKSIIACFRTSRKVPMWKLFIEDYPEYKEALINV